MSVGELELDLSAEREKIAADLQGTEALENLTALIDVNDLQTIITFGENATKPLAKVSDEVLRSLQSSAIEGASPLIGSLAHVMDRTDPAYEKKSLLGKLRNLGKASDEDTWLASYQELSGEMDRVYISLREYQEKLKHTSEQLQRVFETNVDAYRELVRYTVAGKQAAKEIRDYWAERAALLQTQPDDELSMEVQTLQQALNLMEQRVQDLQTTETVVLQSLPMLQTLVLQHVQLKEKIETAFLVTIPLFKQGLAQAVTMKRRRLAMQGLQDVRQRSEDWMTQNVRVVNEQSALENTRSVILQGIEETEALQASAQRRTKEDLQRLQKMPTIHTW